MMYKKFSDLLHKISTGPVTLAALVIFIIFTAVALPAQAAEMEENTHGAGSPDTSLFYTPADLYHMAEVYGAQGRAAYLRLRFTFDLLWPVVYTLFLATATGWLSRRAFPSASRWQLSNLIPVSGMLLDYLENICAAVVIGRYPMQTPVVDWLAPIFTFLKWASLGLSFLILLTVLILAIWHRNPPGSA